MARRDEDPISLPLMEEMSIFVKKKDLKEILEHYLKRVLLEKPEVSLALIRGTY